MNTIVSRQFAKYISDDGSCHPNMLTVFSYRSRTEAKYLQMYWNWNVNAAQRCGRSLVSGGGVISIIFKIRRRYFQNLIPEILFDFFDKKTDTNWSTKIEESY